MSRSVLPTAGFLSIGLTFAAVAQTQQPDVTPAASRRPAVDTDLVESVASLESRVVAIERRLDDRAEQTQPGPGLIRFDHVVTNLLEERLTRYVGMSIVLAVDKDQEQSAVQAITQIKPLLKDWLLLHLSEKTLEAVNGKRKQIGLRDEIRTGFNSQLAEAGYSEFVQAVLFDEFSVQ